MSQNQETIELPKIQLGMGSGPKFTLTFKSETSKELWIKEHKNKATLFADNYVLLEGHLCLVQIEQPEPSAAEKPKAPRVAGGVGKAQSFTMDYSTGRITRPY